MDRDKSVRSYRRAEPYKTKDGSLIRELMHPDASEAKNQSLAEATVLPGCAALPHKHNRSEEIYHVTRGQGLVTLGRKSFEIGPGDTVLIPPGTPHRLKNTGHGDLVVLCACSPPYSHEDTELVRDRSPENPDAGT